MLSDSRFQRLKGGRSRWSIPEHIPTPKPQGEIGGLFITDRLLVDVGQGVEGGRAFADNASKIWQLVFKLTDCVRPQAVETDQNHMTNLGPRQWTMTDNNEYR